MVSDKKWNGYFTVEASFIMPIVLFLYMAVLSAALLLYNRCILSQDCFLLGMRAGRFTKAEENYGEVIYGNEEEGGWQKQYVADRMQRKAVFYPGVALDAIECEVSNDRAEVKCWGRMRPDGTVKIVDRSNPVTVIREGRRK